jgi:hypothetical protein
MSEKSYRILSMEEMHKADLKEVTICDRKVLSTLRQSPKVDEHGQLKFFGEKFNVISPELLQNCGKRLTVTGGIRAGGAYIVGYMVKEIPHPVGIFCTESYGEPYFSEFMQTIGL